MHRLASRASDQLEVDPYGSLWDISKDTIESGLTNGVTYTINIDQEVVNL